MEGAFMSNENFGLMLHALEPLDYRESLDSPGPSPHTHQSIGAPQVGSLGRDTSASACRPADASICEDCAGTGWRSRRSDSAPMVCWCECGDSLEAGL